MTKVTDVIYANPKARVTTAYDKMNTAQKGQLDFINEAIDSLGPRYHEVASLAEKYGISANLKKEFPKVEQALKLYRQKWKLISKVPNY